MREIKGHASNVAAIIMMVLFAVICLRDLVKILRTKMRMVCLLCHSHWHSVAESLCQSSSIVKQVVQMKITQNIVQSNSSLELPLKIQFGQKCFHRFIFPFVLLFCVTI